MILDVFRELGLAWSPYGYCDDDHDEEESDTGAKLDKVDVADCILRNKLHAAAHSFGYMAFILAVSIVTLPGSFEHYVLRSYFEFGVGLPTPGETRLGTFPWCLG